MLRQPPPLRKITPPIHPAPRELLTPARVQPSCPQPAPSSPTQPAANILSPERLPAIQQVLEQEGPLLFSSSRLALYRVDRLPANKHRSPTLPRPFLIYAGPHAHLRTSAPIRIAPQPLDTRRHRHGVGRHRAWSSLLARHMASVTTDLHAPNTSRNRYASLPQTPLAHRCLLPSSSAAIPSDNRLTPAKCSSRKRPHSPRRRIMCLTFSPIAYLRRRIA